MLQFLLLMNQKMTRCRIFYYQLMKQDMFSLDVITNFSARGLLQLRDRLATGTAEFLCLDFFKTHLDKYLFIYSQLFLLWERRYGQGTLMDQPIALSRKSNNSALRAEFKLLNVSLHAPCSRYLSRI